MNQRVVFNSKEMRDLFFQKVLESSKLERWRDFRMFFKIPKSMLEFYRNGKLTLPLEQYEKFLFTLQKKDMEFFKKNINYLDSNWGRIKAGKITQGKYPSLFDEGRKKAIARAKAQSNKFNINLPLSPKLAYFIGLFIGDGFTNKYNHSYIVQFTGDKSEEQFYRELVSNYSRVLFGILPKIRYDKLSKAIRVNFYSKNLFEMIIQRFKIAAGRKSRTVLIPKEILNSEPEILKACIKGLYDAEGCVFFDRRESYIQPYPRIELHMCNMALLKQVSLILTRFDIDNILGTSKDNLRVTIYGNKNVKRFVKEIGFMNPKQLKKLDLLKD